MVIVLLNRSSDEPEDSCGDLMEALKGAASHQPITNPATDRTTVYLQASTAGCIKEVVTCQRLTTNPAPDLDR